MNVLVSLSKLTLSAKRVVRVAMNFKLYVVITNSIYQMIRLYEKRMSVELWVIVIIVFKHYPSTYCIMQGSCFICSNVLKF